MSNRLIGYQSGQGFLYGLSGASKMIFFILVSVACMATYDPMISTTNETSFHRILARLKR